MATRKKSTFMARPVNTRKMLAGSKGSPNAKLRQYSRGSSGFPTGASRFPSTAKTKAEFTKMLGTATPARRKSLQSQFKRINGTSWRGSATKFPTTSDVNRKAAAAGVKKGTPRKKTAANTAEVRNLMASSRRKSATSTLSKPGVRRGRNPSPGTPRKRVSNVRAAYYGGGPNSAAYFPSTTGTRGKTTTAARKRLNAAKRKRRTAKKR